MVKSESMLACVQLACLLQLAYSVTPARSHDITKLLNFVAIRPMSRDENFKLQFVSKRSSDRSECQIFCGFIVQRQQWSMAQRNKLQSPSYGGYECNILL